MPQDKSVYEQKLAQLQAKANTNLQRFIDSAFLMVENARDIDERIKELQELLRGEPKKDGKP
jgi:hypothetical protein